MTHGDYNPKVPKSEQRYRVRCAEGVTLGHLVDAMIELFEKHPAAKFVMVESVRSPSVDSSDGNLQPVDDRPTTKPYMPGSSAEKGWQRG